MEPRELSPVFEIYNASAGAGKTFSLVKKYLERLLQTSSPKTFHRLLALTFTNKAVYEMKSRILKKLHELSISENLADNVMALQISTSLGLPPAIIQQRAQKVLHHLLQDYGAFDVITLDSFTHRVIRTFAKDLGLNYNFQVELNQKLLLSTVVDRVLAKVGHDEEMTQLLLAFTYQKIDQDMSSSWDLKNSLMEVAALLLNENDRSNTLRLAERSPQEWKAQSTFLHLERQKAAQQLVKIGEEVMLLIHSHGLIPEDFIRKTLYQKFKGLQLENFDPFDQGQWKVPLINGQPLYPKKTAQEKQRLIDELHPTFARSYVAAKTVLNRWRLLKAIQKQHPLLRLLTRLSQQLEDTQKATNKVLLSTFNHRIQKEILAHPAPYIYERLGENYRHYFIDEFQDTSTLQWNNLIPLISACFTQEVDQDTLGSVLLVGDPKQSIYRWRGGNVDQFIALLDKKEKPFTVAQNIVALPSNYRSFSAIVAFNNALFKLLPALMESPVNQSLYGSPATQIIEKKEEGLVHLTFFSCDKKQRKEAHLNSVLQQIELLKEKGYPLRNMAILVRTKGEGQAMAKLLEQQQIPFVSSDSLLLSENTSVQFLVQLLCCFIYPQERFPKKEVLTFLHTHGPQTTDLHDYLLQNLDLSLAQIFDEYAIDFDPAIFGFLSVYEGFEKAIDAFPGISSQDAFIAGFMDVVFRFKGEENNSPAAFLAYWHEQREKLTLALGQHIEGVRIMTIHKAKGLEFPIVFFPFADRLIHAHHREKVWLDTAAEFGEDYPLAWINRTKEIATYSPEAEQVYATQKDQQEIDAWNVFYVATTRASEQLYLYADKARIDQPSYAQLLALLLQKEGKSLEEEQYTWGTAPEAKQAEFSPSTVTSIQLEAPKRFPYEKQLLLQAHTSEELESIRHLGILIHDLLARIEYANQTESVLEEAYRRGEIADDQHRQLMQLFSELMQDSSLAVYYSEAFSVWNEHSLVVGGEKILRPDRMVINEKQVVIIDYKTGKKKEEHFAQVQEYMTAAATATGKIASGYLVYFDNLQAHAIVHVPAVATMDLNPKNEPRHD